MRKKQLFEKWVEEHVEHLEAILLSAEAHSLPESLIVDIQVDFTVVRFSDTAP